MPVNDTPASPAFLEAERNVFARYSLESRRRRLDLARPALGVGALEVGSGEPALLLHGVSLCSAHWAPLVARLPSLRCIALDMPGHGGSDAVDFRGVDLRGWHTSMLAACLDELALDSAHLVGHSYGAQVALWLALDAPERVRSIALIGAPAVAFGARPDRTLRMLALHGLGPLALSLPTPLPVYRRALSASLGHHAVDALPELARATYLGTRRPGFARTVSTYLREQFRGVRAEPRRYVLGDDELTQIRQPALVVWGEQDDRYQSPAEGRARAALIPNGRFTLVPGGHEPWLDDPDACAAAVSQFVPPL